MRDTSPGWFFFPCTMVSSSRSLFVDSIFILQPMCDKTSCRDSWITRIYTIYTLKLLVLLDLHPEQEVLVGFFSSTETPNFEKIYLFINCYFQAKRRSCCSNKVTEVLCSKPILHTISVSLGNSTKVQHSPPTLNTADILIKYNCLSFRTTDLHSPLSMYREHSSLWDLD